MNREWRVINICFLIDYITSQSIFIIKYLSVFQTDFKKNNDFVSFIQNLKEEHFNNQQ